MQLVSTAYHGSGQISKGFLRKIWGRIFCWPYALLSTQPTVVHILCNVTFLHLLQFDKSFFFSISCYRCLLVVQQPTNLHYFCLDAINPTHFSIFEPLYFSAFDTATCSQSLSNSVDKSCLKSCSIVCRGWFKMVVSSKLCFPFMYLLSSFFSTEVFHC